MATNKVGAPEEWRAIEGFEGSYEVSNMGRVRSLDRTRVAKNGVTLRFPGKILAAHRSGRRNLDGQRGHLSLALSRDGKEVKAKPHILVAAAFIGPRPKGHHVNHIDGDKTNNRLSNLEYVTPSENARHAFETGLTPQPPRRLGVRHPRSKLTPDLVRSIRRRARRGDKRAAIADDAGVSIHAIKDVLAGRTWSHIPDES